jgi:hypothetical protein
MPKRLINIQDLDHPEHYDDMIREFQSEDRYYPGPLANHLFEVAGHRCTICQAPWLEIHHIEPLRGGGRTEYSNLIVLCPNCHTRVHAENVPTPDELRHYKLKQEIMYDLPSFGRLEQSDKGVIQRFVSVDDTVLSAYEVAGSFETPIGTQEDARTEARRANAVYLQECGMINFMITCIGISAQLTHRVDYRIALTSKGIRWIRYIRDSGKLDTILG